MAASLDPNKYPRELEILILYLNEKLQATYGSEAVDIQLSPSDEKNKNAAIKMQFALHHYLKALSLNGTEEQRGVAAGVSRAYSFLTRQRPDGAYYIKAQLRAGTLLPPETMFKLIEDMEKLKAQRIAEPETPISDSGILSSGSILDKLGYGTGGQRTATPDSDDESN